MSPHTAASSAACPVAVTGGGPAGLVTALLMAHAGIETMLIAPETGPDTRTTALMQGSLDILESLGLWPALKAVSGPLRRLRILDATRRIVRAPEVTFNASDMALDAFGWNIPNSELVPALRAAASGMSHLRVIPEKALIIEPEEDAVRIVTESSETRALLLAAAEGRMSPSRDAAAIATREWRYDQMALVLNLDHDLSHQDTSTEFHTESGPFTLVPLPGDRRSSLVAVLRPDDAERLHGMNDDALGTELTRRAHFILGDMRPFGPRGLFPLGGLVARRFAAQRIALVGEAGHVMPPIGAQGLNLGLRDALRIAELASAAYRMGTDPGSRAVLSAYDRARRADVWGRTAMVDALNRSLLADFLPLDVARSAGLAALAHVPLLRQLAMRLGLGGRAA